jgi:hypothetical protein
MQSITRIAALACLCLTWMAAHADPVESEGAAPPEAAREAAAFDGTVIERTFGEGPVETIAVRQGAVIRLILHAPAGAELHLHGYDAGGVADEKAPVILTFRADQLGRFPIEAHLHGDLLGRSHRALAYIEVRPE